MRLQLQLPEPNPQIASLLTDWAAEAELRLGRRVLPDSAEAAVIDCAAILRTLAPNAAASSPTRESGAPREGLN